MLSRSLCASLLVSVAVMGCGDAAPPSVPAPAPRATVAVEVPVAAPTPRSVDDVDPPAAPTDASCDAALAALVSKLKSPLEILAYQSHTPGSADAFARKLGAFLRRIERSSRGNVTVRVDYPSTPEARAHALAAGCMESKLSEASLSPLSCVTFKYRTNNDAVKYLPTDSFDGTPFWIANKLREVIDVGDGVRHRIGVLRGHGEPGLDEVSLVSENMGRTTLKQIIASNFPSTAPEDVDLSSGRKELDPTLDGLILTQPDKDISDAELRVIDRFVLRGKRIAVFAGAANVKRGDTTLQATLAMHGVDKLLAGYGVRMHRDVVLDFGSSYRARVVSSFGGSVAEMHVPFVPEIVDERIVATAIPFFRIATLAVPMASSLELVPAVQPKATVSALLRSSQSATRDNSATMSLVVSRKWQAGTPGEAVLGAIVEGRIKSAFGAEESASSGGVLMVSSAEFWRTRSRAPSTAQSRST